MDESYSLRESYIVEENQGEDFYFWLNPDGSLPFPGTRGIIICFVSSVRTSKGSSQKKITGKCGNFEKTGGGGLPKSHFFCNLTKWIFACQIHSEVLKHVLQ